MRLVASIIPAATLAIIAAASSVRSQNNDVPLVPATAESVAMLCETYNDFREVVNLRHEQGRIPEERWIIYQETDGKIAPICENQGVIQPGLETVAIINAILQMTLDLFDSLIGKET